MTRGGTNAASEMSKRNSTDSSMSMVHGRRLHGLVAGLRTEMRIMTGVEDGNIQSHALEIPW